MAPRTTRRLLILVVVAVAGTLAVASVTSAASTLSIRASKTQTKYNKTTLRAKHGKVTIAMANPSSFKHAVSIKGKGVNAKGKIVGKGKTSRVSATLKKGTYTFYCQVGDHASAGMKGKLIVN